MKLSQIGRPRTRNVLVTPNIASNYLKINHPHNRNLCVSQLAKLVRDMQQGNYIPCVASIDFDTNGYMYNGQHTCSAIVKSNLPQWVRVSTGNNADALLAADTGKARPTGDLMKLNGINAPRKVAEIVGALTRLGQLPKNTTKIDSLSIIEKNQKQFSLVEEWFKGGKKHRGIATAVAKAAAVCAMVHEPAEEIYKFVNVFIGGPTNERRDDVALALRNKFLANPEKVYAGVGGELQFKQMKTAIHKFIHGKKGGYTTPEALYPFKQN